jgi:hypothetical protein
LANSNILNQIAARNPKSSGVIATTNGSHHTITMGNIQPLTSLTLSGLNGTSNDWDIFGNKNVKKYEVFETTEDILALSVTWHRLRPLISHNISNIMNPSNRPTKLTDEILFKEMIQEDRDKANVIRDYYSKKLMVITLREQRISKFRKDLSTFIHGDSKVVREELMPIIYRLPEFYEYDIEFDEMVRELNTRFEFPEHTTAWSGTKTLTPVKKFVVKHKTNKFSEYWLKDDDNKLCKIEIPIDNKLNHLWEHFFEQDSVPLEGLYKHMERDGISYFHLKNWEIDFTKI